MSFAGESLASNDDCPSFEENSEWASTTQISLSAYFLHRDTKKHILFNLKLKNRHTRHLIYIPM